MQTTRDPSLGAVGITCAGLVAPGVDGPTTTGTSLVGVGVRCDPPSPPNGPNGRKATIAISRKKALFAGSDEGAANWAAVSSLVETCKLNGVEPQAYLTDVITRIVAGHPQSNIDDLLPWAYAPQPLRAVA